MIDRVYEARVKLEHSRYMSDADAHDGPESEEKLLQVAAVYTLIAIAERLDKILKHLDGEDND